MQNQLANLDAAKKELDKGKETADEYDFVGCGEKDIPLADLTGARIDLCLFTQAVLRGMDTFPIKNKSNEHCYDIVDYLNCLSSSDLDGVLVQIKNLGVQENPKFRNDVKLCKRLRYKGETKQEMIVRIAKAITSKDLELPMSVQVLDEELKRKREVARPKREREEAESVADTNDRMPLSDENMNFAKDFSQCYTPKKKRCIGSGAPRTPLDEMRMLRDTMPSTDS